METIEGLELNRELGRGGFGVVHLASQPALDREVAVKILTADGSDPVVRARFERECQAIGKLSSHPNVVAVYGNGTTSENRPYLVMEYLPGGTLTDRMPLSWEEASEVGVGIAAALAAAHRSNITHRDVKPQNILFTEFATPKLADFGIASIVNGFETQSSSVSASIAYAAPEVLDGRLASPRSDIYSLAATVVGAILGHGPFHRDEDSVAALVARVATGPVPDLRDIGVPDQVCVVLERALAKDPQDRQPDAVTFGTELAEAAGISVGAPLTSSVPVVPAEPLPSDAAQEVPAEVAPVEDGSTRGRGLLVGAAAALILLLGAVAIVATNRDSKKINAQGVDQGALIQSDLPAGDAPGLDSGTPATDVTTDSSVPDDGSVDVIPESETDPGLAGPGLVGDPQTGAGSTGGAWPSGVSDGGVSGGGAQPSTGAQGTSKVASGSGSTGTGSSGKPTGSGSTGTTTTTTATTTTMGNRAPLLPAQTFDFRVPTKKNTVIVPAGDKRLSAGWSDPDHTSQWLCLELIMVSQDWWADGANCEGSGLWVVAETPGVRILELRAKECNPGCGAPYSTTRRTVRVEFYDQ
ncbi:MAG: serine/threonine protein kinase [Microthrixaceae bacterium]|nr:serine/threonine protein kinase [Microthrixaceae bacterium]